MSKPRIPNQRNANIEHKKRTERYVMLIKQVYDRLANEASHRAAMTGHDPMEPFSFADYPMTAEAIKELQAQFIGEVGSIIMAGTSNEWKESNLIQDLVAKKVLTAYTGTSKNGEEYTRYYETNPDALKAFQQRRDSGMKLSDRVWNLSEQYKAELEMAISAAIAPGVSAQQLSQDVRKFLNEPDLMFRRFRYKDDAGRWRKKWKRRITDEDGNVRFIDCDKDSYRNQWTGPGYYKSSFKNAMRLARTEINMAYRTAEQKRWEQFDFVVGYEVKITQNGKHVEDICDCLKGKYRKDFVFRGWHPQCMCYSIPILKTEDEFWEVGDVESENEVTDVPQGFKDWVKDNEERIERAAERGKLPYFLRDNPNEVNKILHPEKIAEIQASAPLSIQDKTSRFDDEYIARIEERGIKFKEDLQERMKESPFNRIDIVKLNDDMQDIFSKQGETDLSCAIFHDKDDSLNVRWFGNTVTIKRKFYIDEEGRLCVDHEKFSMPKSMQGKGISKQVFRSLYEQYSNIGVERMEVYANIDVGGYTWARYGFCAKDRDAVLGAVRFSNLTTKQEKRIMTLIDEYFNSTSDPFPMNKIANLPFGKKALLGGDWEGVLDLTKRQQRETFERYLRR